jgi:hypothetical protein
METRLSSTTISMIVTQGNDGESGYLSQSSMPLSFGLGKSQRVDGVRVVWPTGASQILEAPIVVRRAITIVEPTAMQDATVPCGRTDPTEFRSIWRPTETQEQPGQLFETN